MTCSNLAFVVMCAVPFLEELALLRGEECDHDGFFREGIFLSDAWCQFVEPFVDCDYVWGKCMVDFPCVDGEIGALIEYRAQVSLNHLLHESDDFWD